MKPLAALLFAVLALPSAGLASLPFVPRSPAGLLRLYGVLTVVLLLVVTVRRDERRGASWRPLALAVALTPFFLYATWSAPAHAAEQVRPASSLIVLALLLAAFAGAGRRVAAGAVIAITVLLGGGLVLAHAGLDTWPARWNPLATPTRVVRAEVPPPEARPGLRPGAPVRVSAEHVALGRGPGPWWEPATRAKVPLAPPIVLIADGAPDARGLESAPGVSFVHASLVQVRHALDLDGFDAVVVLEQGWSAADSARARRWAAAVAGFVRRGGLLVGPPPERRWPPSLARHLAAAGRAQVAGAEGVRRLGLGRVVRAASGEDMRRILATDLWVRPVRTVFDRASVAPRPPRELAADGAAPASRRLGVLLLFVLAAALGAFAWILRGPAPQAMGAVMAALAISTGIAFGVPREPGFTVRGVLLELGGPGGRRVDAVRIEAGSAGYAGHVRFDGAGMVRVLGARLDGLGRVRVAPGAGAWVLREGMARGPAPEEHEDRFVGWARSFLRGELDPKRIRYGRVPLLPVRVEGSAGVPAVVVRVRGG